VCGEVGANGPAEMAFGGRSESPQLSDWWGCRRTPASGSLRSTSGPTSARHGSWTGRAWHPTGPKPIHRATESARRLVLRRASRHERPGDLPLTRIAEPLLEPLWIPSHASHVSHAWTGVTRLRHMRRFVRNPVCGTSTHPTGPIWSPDRASSCLDSCRGTLRCGSQLLLSEAPCSSSHRFAAGAGVAPRTRAAAASALPRALDSPMAESVHCRAAA